MSLLLANPSGLWALLAIPVILLIHFLQERSRRVRVSTLFLLERVKPESVGGARFERLRHSVPLWMQLLAALLLAWLLAEPRWIREDSRQTVVVVLDSSVSMSAFKEETRALLEKKLRDWSRSAAQTEWHLIESDASKPTLYTGTDLSLLLDAYDYWEPVLGTHRPDDALLVARGLVKTNGIVIFATDRKVVVPSDVAVLSVGEEIENMGFAGVEVKLTSDNAGAGMKWRALVKNYGTEAAIREWWVETGGASNAQHRTANLELSAGQTVALSGEFPADVERATLVLRSDRFTRDDRLPLQKPRPRVATADVRVGGRVGELLRKMLGASAHVSLTGTAPADLTIAELGTPAQGDAIQLFINAGETSSLDPSWTVAESHPFTRDLNWMGLLTPRPMELAVTENDEPLLWKGDRVLALLRHDRTTTGRKIRRLLLGWDVSQSNADRHPAMLVMIHRFIESVREGKREPWADNFETGQPVNVAALEASSSAAEGKPGRRLVLAEEGRPEVPFTGRAPERPGFFRVIEGGKPWLSGATHFADAREADFRDAAPLDTVEQRRWEAALKQTEADPWMPLWVLLLLACFITAWAWRQKHAPKPRTPASADALSTVH